MGTVGNDRSVTGGYGSALVLCVSITKRCRCLNTSTGSWILSKSNGTRSSDAIAFCCIA